MTLVFIKSADTKKIFFLIFGIVFTVFLFTSDGHRYSIDEWHPQQMALRMITLEPDPAYIQGESKPSFNIPIMNPNNLGPLCSNAITCYPTGIFHSITQVPFIAINHYFHIIDSTTPVLAVGDFHDQHYIFWRNSENVDLVFMELFYGPFFSALSVTIFFLICLEYKFSRNNSIILSFLLAFSTMIWAYSNTSLNLLPVLFLVLLGYLFYKKFQRTTKSKFLIFSSASLGFAFLIRSDVILFIIPIFIFLLISIFRKNSKVYSLFFYLLPLLFSFFGNKFVNSLRYISSTHDNESSSSTLGTSISAEFNWICFNCLTGAWIDVSSNLTGVFGLLFAPGVGLFIFCPILLTVFFSFPDFFRKNKHDCLLLLSFFVMNLVYHLDFSASHWHGLVAWGPRYLLLMVPFLLIPLGASLGKRNKKFMFSLIVILGIMGVLFNMAYVVQDVSWFVWGTPGAPPPNGLFGLGAVTDDLYINDAVLWSFQFSQLTQSMVLMFGGLQHDIYLLHLLGTSVYSIIFVSFLSFLFYLFWRIKKYTFKENLKNVKEKMKTLEK